MKLQRIVSCITGVFFAVGFAASQAGAGSGPPGCDFDLEINALRGGSPTVSVGTKNITAKARISKGTAPSDTLIDVDLVIQSFVNGLLVDNEQSSGPIGTYPIRLGVGKGGQGDKLGMQFVQGDCVLGDLIDFTATFSGPDSGGDICTISRTITKTCK
jgi:hypothetical protein